MRTKDFKPSLAGRPLTHPDVAHLEAILEENKRNMRAIDKVLAPRAYKRTITRRDALSAHDIAASNPILRNLLKQMQK
jgi:hypothetical protein